MKLVHFSKKKIKFDKNYSYKLPQEGAIAGWKPVGFWFSDEDDFGWKEWCTGEDFNMDGFKYAYEVIPEKDHKILCIHTLEELEAFKAEYGCENPIYSSSYPQHMREDSIAWKEVAKKYNGIFISPYRWEKRLETGYMWYYGWDCASGCVWNLEAIKELKLIK